MKKISDFVKATSAFALNFTLFGYTVKRHELMSPKNLSESQLNEARIRYEQLNEGDMLINPLVRQMQRACYNIKRYDEKQVEEIKPSFKHSK